MEKDSKQEELTEPEQERIIAIIEEMIVESERMAGVVLPVKFKELIKRIRETYVVRDN